MFQFITKNRIKQTRDWKDTLFNWIEEVAGEWAAIEATSWAELAEYGEEYEGEGFKLRCVEG